MIYYHGSHNLNQVIRHGSCLTDDERVAREYADDTGHVEALEAGTLSGAITEARKLLRSGDWGMDMMEQPKTLRVRAFIDDLDGDTHEVHEDIDPPVPECYAEDHSWQSPHELLGGLEENPGVQGHGGGVIISEVCANCGRYRVHDTWDTDTETGEPMETVTYPPADERSRAWAQEQEDN